MGLRLPRDLPFVVQRQFRNVETRPGAAVSVRACSVLDHSDRSAGSEYGRKSLLLCCEAIALRVILHIWLITLPSSL